MATKAQRRADEAAAKALFLALGADWRVVALVRFLRLLAMVPR